MVRRVELQFKGKTRQVEFEALNQSSVTIRIDGDPFLVELEGLDVGRPRVRSIRPLRHSRPTGLTGQDNNPQIISAPMVGKIVSVEVVSGETVEPGMVVCVLEAMKMEQSITCSRAGVVKEIRVQPGDSIAQGDVLIVLE